MERTQDCWVRRPPNPFLIFSNENRTTLCRQNPELGNRDISKLLGDLWSQLDPNEKQEFVKRAQILRTQHLMENPEYNFKWKAKMLRKMKAQRKTERMNRKSKADGSSNVIIWRATEWPKTFLNQLCGSQTSGCPGVTSLEKEEKPITEEKRIFMKRLGLCESNSFEYFSIQSKHTLNALNYQMFDCIQMVSRRRQAKTKNENKDQIMPKRPRGRPRKYFPEVVASNQSIIS